MRRPTKTTNVAGGMFEEFEPAPAPVKPTTAPLFEVSKSDYVTVAPDYGKAKAPEREERAALISDFLVLEVGEDGAMSIVVDGA